MSPSWGEILKDMGDGGFNPDELRQRYLKQVYECTGRNIITYYSAWLQQDKEGNIDINDSDLTGFMNAVKGMDVTKGLDLILHTPGGIPTAAEGIVQYLHTKFGNNIRVIVPHMAMSAGTMMACASKEIIMGTHSFLGPIDPQYEGISAYNIIKEFEEARKELESKPEALEYWKLRLGKYTKAYYYTVKDAIDLSRVLVEKWLKNYMFKGEEEAVAKEKTENILNVLNSNNKSHARHFNYELCKQIGLKVEKLEADQKFQESVLSLHHSYTITFENTTVNKIIENQNGTRYISHMKVK